MPNDSKKKSVDLEARFVKKFSPTILVTMLNTSAPLGKIVRQELSDAIFDLTQEANSLERSKLTAVVSLASDELDVTLYGAPADRRLHRSLYRQSRFFNEVKCISMSYDQANGTAQVRLHVEEAPPISTAVTINPHELDIFNKYVLLHLLPFFRKQWRLQVADDNYQRVHSILEEVVMDKIGGLRELRQEVDD